MSGEDLKNLIERLEKVTCRLESCSIGRGPASSAAGGGALQEDSVFVNDYDLITSGPLADFVTASKTIGGLVNDQAQLLKDAMAAQRVYLVIASKSKKPPQELKEKNRRSEQFNHLAALAEGVAALGWVTIEPTPAPHVKEMADAGMFYVNRVLKEYKEKDKVHTDWTRALQSLWKDLQAYVEQHHLTGLTWNPAGGDAMSVSVAAGAPAPPPPPGPAPPPPPPSAGPVKPAAPAVDTGALFADLNKGAAITSGLKKVSDDMKTHKNPALREGPAPFKPPVTAPKPFKAAAPAAVSKPVAKPPLVELQGKKWVVEHLVNNNTTVIDDTNNKQTVYIYKCINSTVQVKGKINSITLDNCKKTAVVFEDAISVVEFINCQSVKCQVLNKVPTVSIEKTDGCQVFLSKDSLDTSFISAKSSEMNVVIPTADGDYSEYAIAEQFKTVFNGKTLVTEVNDIAA